MEPQDTAAGWVVVSGGLRYLAGDTGWVELVDAELRPYRDPDLRAGVAVEVVGERLTPVAFRVDHVASMGAGPTGNPPLVAEPPSLVMLAARARLAADAHLAGIGYPLVMLPSLWSLSREYGEEELVATHSAMSGSLSLLQSPELPMYAALACGLRRFSSWGRCFRFEKGATDGRHLMEFEQIDIGSSHTSLAAMMRVTEGVVRAVAGALQVDLPPGPFPVADRTPDDDLEVPIPAHAGPDVTDVVLARLTAVGATGSVHERPDGRAIAVRVRADAVRADVQRVVDSARRVLGTADHVGPRLVWRTPLPLEWEPGEGGDSEYPVRSLTSARRTDERSGRPVLEEAELYVDGSEVAHAGVFADFAGLRDAIAEAGVVDGRYDWLLPLLAQAPPSMAKVGIGWERLVAALLGQAELQRFQLFPRSAAGELLMPNGHGL